MIRRIRHHEENWDESDIEVDDSSTEELHALAKPFVKWIAALIWDFKHLCTKQCYSSVDIYLSAHTFYHTAHLLSYPFLLAVCTILPGSLYLAWRLLKVDEDEFI